VRTVVASFPWRLNRDWRMRAGCLSGTHIAVCQASAAGSRSRCSLPGQTGLASLIDLLTIVGVARLGAHITATASSPPGRRSWTPAACPICGGMPEPGTTTFTADLTASVLVIRDVPALVCRQCGEAWLADDTAARLEAAVQQARTRQSVVEVTHWSQIAA
jgi:YgiT-type zinc finger domain-containing protein